MFFTLSSADKHNYSQATFSKKWSTILMNHTWVTWSCSGRMVVGWAIINIVSISWYKSRHRLRRLISFDVLYCCSLLFTDFTMNWCYFWQLWMLYPKYWWLFMIKIVNILWKHQKSSVQSRSMVFGFKILWYLIWPQCPIKMQIQAKNAKPFLLQVSQMRRFAAFTLLMWQQIDNFWILNCNQTNQD